MSLLGSGKTMGIAHEGFGQTKANGGDFQPVDFSKEDGNVEPLTMVQKAQNWLSQHGITIALIIITGVVTFTYQQFQVSNLLEKNNALQLTIKENKTEAEQRLAEVKAELKKEVADAQAYAVSARGEAKYVAGILIGKGLASPTDFQNYQQQQQR